MSSIAISLLLLGILSHCISLFVNSRLRFRQIALIASSADIGAFATLCLAYIISDFSLANVHDNSHTLMPLIYKISGAWSNNEGSFALWLAIFSASGIVLTLDRSTPLLSAKIHQFFTLAFAVFIFFLANPFLSVAGETGDGLGFNPILQDSAQMIHPPILYSGLIIFAIPFCIIIAATARQSIDQRQILLITRYNSIAVSLLTLGIGMGSWWAYRELGWGGFWFWDPVENLSLLPWFGGIIAIHILARVNKTGQLKPFGLVMISAINFLIVLLGVFLVRSGVLVSVHSFASNQIQGAGLMAIFLIAIFVASGVMLYRMPYLMTTIFCHNNTQNLSKRFLLANNFLFAVALILMISSLITPLVYEKLGMETISLSSQYYNAIFYPLGLASINLLTIYSMAILGIRAIRLVVFGATIAIASFFFPIAITIILIALNLMIFVNKKTNRRTASLLSHSGFGLMILAIFLISSGDEKEMIVSVGDNINFAGESISFQKIAYRNGQNYIARQYFFTLKSVNLGNKEIIAETRYFPVEDKVASISGHFHNLAGDLQIIVGDKRGGGYMVKLYNKPFIYLLWLSVILMSCGAMVIPLYGKSQI